MTDKEKEEMADVLVALARMFEKSEAIAAERVLLWGKYNDLLKKQLDDEIVKDSLKLEDGHEENIQIH